MKTIKSIVCWMMIIPKNMKIKKFHQGLALFGVIIANIVRLDYAHGQTNISETDLIDLKAKLEEVFSGGEGLLLEGPAMSPNGTLYFTDITFTHVEGMKAGIIWTYNPETGETKVFRSPSGMANGLAFDTNGNLIACEGADFGGRRITKTDMKSGKSIILAGQFNNSPFNAPNDLVIDIHGRIYFTDPRYFGKESVDQPVNGVYRIDLDGSVHLIIANNSKPNGITISPDQKTMYVAKYDFNGLSGPLPDDFKGPTPQTSGSVLAYTMLPDGNVEYKGVLINLENRGADGLKVDIDGNLYIALGGEIGIYSPQGKRLASVPSRKYFDKVAVL